MSSAGDTEASHLIHCRERRTKKGEGFSLGNISFFKVRLIGLVQRGLF